MSIDKLQDRIRKLKSPLALDLFAQPEHIPHGFLENGDSFVEAYLAYCGQLLETLTETVSAVRLDYGVLAFYGAKGIEALSQIADKAHKLGYYVLLQIPEPLSRRVAAFEAGCLFASDAPIWFDGLMLTAYIGSDAVAPFADYLKESEKDLFVVARTSNRSAAEMQELRSGSRLAYLAKADIAKRYADGLAGRKGYSRIGLVAAASSADCLRSLRQKYSNLFLVLDGCDYPNANAKNCSLAFDKLGFGALACIGLSVMAAWQESEEAADPIESAKRAAERYKKNLLRYVTVL